MANQTRAPYRHSHYVWIEGKRHSLNHLHDVDPSMAHSHTVGPKTDGTFWSRKTEHKLRAAFNEV